MNFTNFTNFQSSWIIILCLGYGLNWSQSDTCAITISCNSWNVMWKLEIYNQMLKWTCAYENIMWASRSQISKVGCSDHKVLFFLGEKIVIWHLLRVDRFFEIKMLTSIFIFILFDWFPTWNLSSFTNPLSCHDDLVGGKTRNNKKQQETRDLCHNKSCLSAKEKSSQIMNYSLGVDKSTGGIPLNSFDWFSSR